MGGIIILGWIITLSIYIFSVLVNLLLLRKLYVDSEGRTSMDMFQIFIALIPFFNLLQVPYTLVQINEWRSNMRKRTLVEMILGVNKFEEH